MDETKKIIMVNGKKRAGKDFFSDMLCERFDYTKVALARKLKDAACSIAGISFDEMENLKNNGGAFSIHKDLYVLMTKMALITSFDELNINKSELDKFKKRMEEFNYDSLQHAIKEDTYYFDARIFLQEMGGIWKVVFNDDQIWAKLCVASIASTNKNVIISDFRYPYELDLVKEYYDNVYSVKVIGKNLYESDQYDLHSSETALNDYKFQYHINNTFWYSPAMDAQVVGLMREINV